MSRVISNYEEASVILQATEVSRSKLKKISVGLARKLCEEQQLTPRQSGRRGKSIKDDYVEALYDFVSSTRHESK